MNRIREITASTVRLTSELFVTGNVHCTNDQMLIERDTIDEERMMEES